MFVNLISIVAVVDVLSSSVPIAVKVCQPSVGAVVVQTRVKYPS